MDIHPRQFAHPPRCSIAMLAVDGALASAMTAPLDAFRLANALYARTHPGCANYAPFELHLISSDKSQTVQTAGGITMAGLVPAQSVNVDVLLVPGMDYRSHAGLIETVHAKTSALQLIRAMHDGERQIAASCSGTFMLAASGILDGEDATTSWWLAASFRKQFPTVKLDSSKLLVEAPSHSGHGAVITAGAVTAMFSVVLKIIEQRFGPELAQNTARILLIDPSRQSQAPFVSEALIQHPRSAFSEAIEQHLAEHLHTDVSVDALSIKLNISARTLLRKFQVIYQQSPQSYIQQLRVDRAKALLETTKLSFAEICAACGYQDGPSFRKLFKRIAGLTPTEYQLRFRLRGP
jgi:transcriptional regulator GlxA family with amidase domain